CWRCWPTASPAPSKPGKPGPPCAAWRRGSVTARPAEDESVCTAVLLRGGRIPILLGVQGRIGIPPHGPACTAHLPIHDRKSRPLKYSRPTGTAGDAGLGSPRSLAARTSNFGPARTT